MKSKQAVYLLGFLVLCIWGLILRRVYLSVYGNEEPALTVLKPMVPVKQILPGLYPDTFKLLLNYPDPFTGEQVKAPDTMELRNSRRLSSAHITSPPLVNPVQQMKYLGYVWVGKGARKVAILNFQGNERMLVEGDTLKGMKLLSVAKDFMTIQHRGKITTIKTAP